MGWFSKQAFTDDQADVRTNIADEERKAKRAEAQGDTAKAAKWRREAALDHDQMRINERQYRKGGYDR